MKHLAEHDSKNDRVNEYFKAANMIYKKIRLNCFNFVQLKWKLL